MRVLSSELGVGDTIRVNDWNLHVVAVEAGLCTGVRTAEFDFLLHFHAQERLDIVRTTQPAGAVP
jgi:hypothetical protein